MNLRKKKVLVTGATGFIGTHLVRELLEKGCAIRILCLPEELDKLRQLKGRVECVKGDICGPLGKAVRNCEVVLHLAGLTDVLSCSKYPEKAFRINTQGTFNLLRSLEPSKLEKFIHLSTAAVYGVPLYLPIDEKHPTIAANPYSASKLAAESFVTAFGATYGLNYSVIRLFNVYGPGQEGNFFIPTMVKQSLAKDEVKLENSDTTRDFVYIGDVVDGILKVAEKGKNEIYNLGGGKEVPVSRVIYEVAGILKKKIRVKVMNINRSNIPRNRADISRIKKEAGWSPRTALRAGLERTVSYWITKLQKQESA